VNTSGWATGQQSFSLAPYSYGEAAEIARALELPAPVAAALVRRGHRTVEDARKYLAAGEHHDPSEFDGMEAAVALIRSAVAAKKLVTVHGDYDVDGVTSTAILVRTIRELGAQCDWLIPSRVDDGYGLSRDTIETLASRGAGLLVTVDCGITSVGEVAHAKSLGIDVIVTDHHQPGAELPDCPIIHPTVSSYPCADLCAAGVAHKVAGALLGVERSERDLDLVALATIADMVPLLGENRSLVRRGLELMRRAPRVGLRALMEVSKVAPERIGESDIGFRLSPRINAAGRLYRADAAVELFLGDDPERAAEIAVELDRANLDRRETEREVLADANRRLSELESGREPGAAIVLWGEGWHPGVVGICASRMAERHMRPAILIAMDSDGRGKGSGRSVPGFDLLGALRACSQSLARFGGHRAAAGLEIEQENLEAFRESLIAHCAQLLPDEPAPRVEDIDAVVGTEALGHELATQFARLGPFGMANPEIRLVVPGARVDDVRPMGEEERHARFTLRGGSGQVRGVAFNVGGTLSKRAAGVPVDASIRLELNEWNGATEPRALLGALYDPAEAPVEDLWRAGDEEWTERFRTALEGAAPFPGTTAPLEARRAVVDRSSASGLAVIGDLTSTGERALILCADALWRRGIVESAVHPDRYGKTEGAIVASRGTLTPAGEAGLVLADWAALSLLPELPRGFRHLVIADPAPHPDLAELVASGDGYLHLLATKRELSLGAVSAALPDRKSLAGAYRAIREPGESLEPEALRLALCGTGGAGRSPEACGLAVRALAEIGVVRTTANGSAIRVEAVSSVRGDLSSSMSFRLIEKAYEECVRYLSQPEKQTSSSLEQAA
jgi:single-stranded-DNA-specific exonuclease